VNGGKRLVGMIALADLGHVAAEAGQVALEGIFEPSDQPRR